MKRTKSMPLLPLTPALALLTGAPAGVRIRGVVQGPSGTGLLVGVMP